MKRKIATLWINGIYVGSIEAEEITHSETISSQSRYVFQTSGTISTIWEAENMEVRITP